MAESATGIIEEEITEKKEVKHQSEKLDPSEKNESCNSVFTKYKYHIFFLILILVLIALYYYFYVYSPQSTHGFVLETPPLSELPTS